MPDYHSLEKVPLKSAAVGILVLAICILFFAYNVPVYPDEINWRVIFTRIREQGWKYYHYTFSCGPLSPIDVPFYVIPQLYVLSGFRDLTSFSSFRIPQILYIIVFLSGAAFYIKNSARISIFAASLFTLAAFVLFNSNVGLVWILSSRPESMLLAFVGACLWAALLRADTSKAHLIDILLCFFWMVVCVAHPKSVYFAPLLLFVIYLRQRKIWWLALIATLVFIYAVGISKFAYLFIINCPVEPDLERMYFAYNANPLLLVTDAQAFLAEIRQNLPGQISNLLTRAPLQLTFNHAYDIGYLPQVKQTAIIFLLNNLIISLYYFVLMLIILSPVALCYSFFTGRVGELALPALIGCIVLVLVFLNRTTNSYEIHFWIALGGSVVTIFYVSQLDRSSFNRFLMVLLIISTTWGFVFSVVYHKNIYSPLRKGWGGVNSGPSTSAIYFRPDSVARISAFKEEVCGDARHFFFDDRTFMSISNEPDSRPYTYFMVPFSLRDAPALHAEAYLSKVGSVNFLGNCAFEAELPANLRNIKGRIDDLNICCFSKK